MPATESEKPPRRIFLRAVFLLWLALVAFGLPEVIAGTGRLWLSNPATYVLVIPLYALHFLLLSAIAIRTGRTSWPALYLFGVVFGLYETWVTKVVWQGYPDNGGFALGAFGSWFGVHETFGLVLFYHAVVSFLLPLAVVSRLFPAFGRHFPVPDWVFGKTRGALLRRLGLLFIFGVVTGNNNPVTGEYLVTWVPMLVLIWAGYVFLRYKGATSADGQVSVSVAAPLHGRTGVAFAALWLAAIYGVTYFKLLPELLPPAPVQLLTLAFYPVLIFLLWKVPRRVADADLRERPNRPARMPFFWLLAVFAVGLLGNVLGNGGAGFRDAMALVAFLAMIPLGLGLFLWLVVWKVIVRPA